jgi:TRAP-type C4-dicarboxylate transport system permease small subunit
MAVGLTMTVAAMALPSVRRSVRRTLAIAGLVVTAACALAQFWVSPEIAKIRAAAGTQLDSLPPNNRLRMQFGRLHGMSVALLGIAWLGGAAVVVLSFFAPQRRA